MVQREISAKEVLKDIRAGLNDARIMEKYGLSSKGLASLYQKMARAGLLEKPVQSQSSPLIRKINAAKIAMEISSGMSDDELMKKYDLSPAGLRQVFDGLHSAGVVLPRGFGGRGPVTDEPVNQVPSESNRLSFRHKIDFILPIFEETDAERVGTVLDISHGGLGVRGLEARRGDTKTLVIPADEFFELERLRVVAVCRWASKDPSDGEPVAGFELIELSPRDVRNLRKLIDLTETMDTIETMKIEGPQQAPDARRLVRHPCSFRVPIHDALQRENRGRIINLTEEGFGIEGLTCKPGERRTLVIPAYQYGKRHFNSIVVVGECRWAHKTEEGAALSGFKIVERTAKNQKELETLVKLCTSPDWG